MPAAQIAVVVRHTKQIVHIAVGRSAADRLTAVVVERRGQEGRQVEARERILHLRLELWIRPSLVSTRDLLRLHKELSLPCR